MTINETVKKNTEKFNEFTIAKSWELDSDKFFLDATPEEIQSHIKQSQLSLMDSMIERLEGEKKYTVGRIVQSISDFENAYNKALQKQIDYLEEERIKIEKI